jgi:hypothetical protein
MGRYVEYKSVDFGRLCYSDVGYPIREIERSEVPDLDWGQPDICP